jgi:hypothetical protein
MVVHKMGRNVGWRVIGLVSRCTIEPEDKISVVVHLIEGGQENTCTALTAANTQAGGTPLYKS